MKIFSAPARENPDADAAWACLTTNLAMPGIGSLMAGRKVAGALQTVLMIAGTVITLVPGGRFIIWFYTNYAELYGNQDADPIAVLSQVWGRALLPLAGVVLFATAWLWSLLTSLLVLRKTRSKPPVLQS